MDKIQKALIKIGRKDLADEYFQRVAVSRKMIISKTRRNLLKEYLKAEKSLKQTYKTLSDLWRKAKNANIELSNAGEEKDKTLNEIASHLRGNVLYTLYESGSSSVKVAMESLKKQIDSL